MDKNIAVIDSQEVRDEPAVADLSEMQLALVGGGIGETIL